MIIVTFIVATLTGFYLGRIYEMLFHHNPDTQDFTRREIEELERLYKK